MESKGRISENRRAVISFKCFITQTIFNYVPAHKIKKPGHLLLEAVRANII